MTDSCSSPNKTSPYSDEAILREKEVILQRNSEPMVLMEAEQEGRAEEGAESLNESSVGVTQCPESKTNPTVPAPDNNPNINNNIDHSSDVEKTDLVRANSEPETIDHKPERSLQISPLTVSTEASGMSERAEMPIQLELDPGQSSTFSGPSPIRPASPTKGEHSKSEMESGQDLPISNPHPARSNNLVQTSQLQETSQYKMALSQPHQMFPTGALAQSLVSALCILHLKPCCSSISKYIGDTCLC